MLQVSEQSKHTGSTQGMQSTVETSPLLERRIQSIPDKLKDIRQAILDKDFPTFAKITMQVCIAWMSTRICTTVIWHHCVRVLWEFSYNYLSIVVFIKEFLDCVKYKLLQYDQYFPFHYFVPFWNNCIANNHCQKKTYCINEWVINGEKLRLITYKHLTINSMWLWCRTVTRCTHVAWIHTHLWCTWRTRHIRLLDWYTGTTTTTKR